MLYNLRLTVYRCLLTDAAPACFQTAFVPPIRRITPMFRYTAALFCALAALPASADETGVLLNRHLDDRRVQEENFRAEPLPAVPQMPSENTADESGTVELDESALAEHPDLLHRAVSAALLTGNTENAAELLPFYRKLPPEQRNEDVLQWAEAAAARYRGDYRASVRAYRKVLAAQPDSFDVRLQLAATLFDNGEWEAAQQQFEKLKSSEELPEQVSTLIEQYLAAIREQDRWQFYGGASYLNDPNINNAPKNRDLGGNWQAPEAESAQGISLNAGISKRHSLPHGFFTEARADGSSRYYWDNRKYSEASLRLSAGGGFQDARHTLTLLPFAEQAWYAGGREHDKSLKRFSLAKGLAADWRYRFSPQWQSSLAAEYAENRYRTRTHLNGHSASASATLYYTPKPQQYWFAGIDAAKVNTQQDDDAYTRKGVRAGWGQEWPLGFSSRLSAGYGERRYQGVNFFNIVQRNKEYSAQASLWHRAVHYRGLTPRLTWAWQKTDSNHALYRYQKQRLFVEVSKQF
ncbi:MAG: surface lipoprotein assembly modifier [Neisseria sp.]|nr:surface lipoprotein assembly modifier [Neisseria sp.]